MATDEDRQYIKSTTVAKMFGFSGVRRIQQLTQDGVISTVEVMENGRKVRRYELIDTVQRYLTHIKKQASGVDQTDQGDSKIKEALASLRYRIAKAEIMELKARELKGQMHRSEDVETITEALVATIRAEILALPGALAVDAAHADTPAKAAAVIKQGVNDLLNNMANYHYDPVAYAKLVMKREQWMGSEQDESEGDSGKTG